MKVIFIYLFIYFAQIEERHSLKEKTQYKEMWKENSSNTK